MSLPAAWVVYPCALLAFCGGLGLLVDVLAGPRLPGALVAPIGLAAIVVVGQFTTVSDATARFTMPVLVFAAVLGAGLSLPWRFGRPDPRALAAAAAVFLVFGAPVLLSGRPTFAGYIKLDDTATWLALTDRVMEHGRSLAGLAPSSYRATLEFNLGSGYPIGAFLPFGAARELVGGDLAWVFQPYLAFLAAMLALALWEILGGVLRRSRARALAAFLAAQPALLVGYSLWGGIKEMAAAALLALAAALAPAALREGGRRRDVLALALASAALVGVLSPVGALWLVPLLAVSAVVAVRRFGARDAGLRACLFVGLLMAFTIPVWTAGIVPPTSKPLVGSDGQGNLLGPLDPLQALGIWPAGDFRTHPDAVVATAILIAPAIFAALLGLATAWRRRAAGLLLFATALLACAAFVVVGSPWLGGKALATASPVALALALAGAGAAVRIDRLAGGALVLAVGVLWSNVLAYGGVDLAPYGQLRELQSIGRRFAGQGPALMTEYNPYGSRHFLRSLDGEGASELRTRQVPLAGGGTARKGAAVDTDQLALPGLLEYRTLVLRRSPARSRPPLPYRLAWAGHYYEVWQRPAAYAGPAPEHLALGGPLDPAGVPHCSEVGGLGELALLHQMRGVRLLAARHASLYEAPGGMLRLPRAGTYEAWLKGSVRGAVELFVDGRKVGSARHQLENEGGFIQLAAPHLTEGVHRVELRFGGADLHPGSGGFPRPSTGPLVFSPAGEEAGRLVTVSIADSDRLCGKRWDWIEAIGSR